MKETRHFGQCKIGILQPKDNLFVRGSFATVIFRLDKE